MHDAGAASVRPDVDGAVVDQRERRDGSSWRHRALADRVAIMLASS